MWKIEKKSKILQGENMDFNDLILSRESVRSYDKSCSVDEETLHRILEAGRLAPSAANKQPWEFWVVSSLEILAKLHACYAREWFRNAPHILIVVGDIEKCWESKEGEYLSLQTDLAIAMTHLILAAANEGVATCWIAAFNPLCLQEALELQPYQRIFGITPLGYPESDYQKIGTKKRKSLKEIVRYL